MKWKSHGCMQKRNAQEKSQQIKDTEQMPPATEVDFEPWQEPNERDLKPGSICTHGHGHIILFHLNCQQISTLPSNNQPKKNKILPSLS
jgi:hypothetical protein